MVCINCIEVLDGGNRMDLDQLAAFDRIVREGGFSRAAVALGIGQPAVSARIRALEESVGGALFTRGRRVALTALGESFLPYARRAVEVLGEGVEAARLAQTGERGRVRLASLASLAGGLVGPALGTLLRGQPEVECVVRAGDHEHVVALLLDGVVDLGLVTWPCTEAAAADLQAILVLHEPVVLVAHPGHPLAARARVGADDVVRLGRPFFRLRWWQRHHPAILALAERAGTAVDLPMETARALALDGVGVGFFVRTFIAEDLARGALVQVEVRDLPRFHRDSALVRRRRSGALSPAAANLVEAVRRQANRLGLLAPVDRARRARSR
jgi:LysR family transcriptional regulator, low CO2-responsive transcriptional regulator